MSAPIDTYAVASGQPIYGGRAAPSTAATFDSLTFFDTNDGPPTASNNGQILVVEVHGSGGSNITNGRQYRAAVSGSMAFSGSTPANSNLPYDAHNTFGFSTVVAYDPTKMPATSNGRFVKLRPVDKWVNENGAVVESGHMGFLRSTDNKFHLISERRYDALMDWADKNLTMFDQTKRVLTGGSMGGWGTASYGIRRYSRFAALYPDRPRWAHDGSGTNVAMASWVGGFSSYAPSATPTLAQEDGGGSMADYMNQVAYVANPANKIRWVGWCLGRNDGFASIQDSIDMVDAMRATKRGFAFYWNSGDHGTGSRLEKITQSYPFGTFSIDKGYPLFTEFSRDNNPRTDKNGGINVGLSFRNVVESATGWSCEIACVLGSSSGQLAAGSTTTVIQLPNTESEMMGDYVGGTITIGSETKTITAYDGTDPVINGAAAKNKLVTVDTAFTTAPAAGTAYTINRKYPVTVKVEPISEVFRVAVAKQTISIPAANVWVPVSFTA